MKRTGVLLPAFALVANAFVWGVSWWPFRQLQAQGLHPLWTTTAVYALAVAVLSMREPARWAELARHRSLWVIALAAGTTNAAFNWGVTIGDVVRVVLLFYLMPVWAVLLAWLLLHERLTRGAIVRVVLALAGAAIVLWPRGETAAVGGTDLLGVVGGFSFALNNVMLRREAQRSDGARALAMFAGGALVAGALGSALCAVARLPAPVMLTPAWLAFALVLALAFLCSNLALQYGATRLRANVTAVIMLTEVLFAAVSSALLGAAVFTPALALGGALIVSAALLAAVSGSRHA